MAKTFYYDSVGLAEATITAGTFTVSGGAFSASSSAITNEHRINDQSIAKAVSSFDDEDMIRINLGSAQTVTRILKYNNQADSDDLWWYQSTSSTNATTDGGLWQFDFDTPLGWDLISGTEKTMQYWYIRSEDATFAGLSEVIMGVPLEFENEPDIGSSTQEVFNTDINTSYGGIEYANKRHNPVSTWTFNFKNISQTFKDKLVSFEQSVTDYKKFVYYDDTNYNYVRLEAPINFVEVAHQRYSASIKLREQLS